MSEKRSLLTSQEKKAYLERYKEADREIDRLCEELSRWRALATKITPVLSQEPAGSCEGGNQIELAVEKIIALEGQINARYSQTLEKPETSNKMRIMSYFFGQMRNPRLYSLWNTMRHRCEDPKRESYQRYGGRGIKVCQEWHDANTFMDWAESHGYKPGLQLDRIDNDGDYSPENCRWVTAKDNSRNKRTNRLLTINGKTKTVSEWCEVYDVSPYTVYWWIREKGYKYAEEKVQSQNTRAPILSEREMEMLNGKENP